VPPNASARAISERLEPAANFGSARCSFSAATRLCCGRHGHRTISSYPEFEANRGHPRNTPSPRWYGESASRGRCRSCSGIAIAVCFRARQALFYLLPVFCFACFCGVVYANWWHVGLLIPLLLCLLWITWPASGCTVSRQERIGRTALTLMAATQILWSAYAVAYDHSHAYSPDLAAAQFLTPYAQSGASIAVTYLDEPEGNQAYDSVGILPYFAHNIFMNQPQFFWFWSTDNPTEDLFFKALRSRPRIVLVEIRKPDHAQLLTINPRLEILKKQKLEMLTKAGYRMTNIFCGIRTERFQLSESSCHEIFQQFPAPQSLPCGRFEHGCAIPAGCAMIHAGLRLQVARSRKHLPCDRCATARVSPF
jgi:hypothetical protein